MAPHTPVIFVHGFIGSLEVPGFRLPHACPDLYGYGNEQAVEASKVSLPGQVKYLHAFIKSRYGDEPVDLVGHSVGGAVAMLFAQAHPAQVRRIVNVEGNFTLDDAFWSGSVGRMSADEADAMLVGFRADPLAWLQRSVDGDPAQLRELATRWLAYQPASTLRAMGRSVVAVTGHADYLAGLQQVFERTPVYLLCGSRSQSGWHVPAWARSKCAGEQVLDGCGHLMMLEDPDGFKRALLTSLVD